MSWHHGICRGCYRVSDSEFCARCEALADEAESRDYHPRPSYAPSNVRIPYDPETDPF